MEDGRQPCGSLWNSFGEINNKGGKMVETMTQETKDRIAQMERQKIDLENQLDLLGYSGNLVRMHQIEEEIYEIEDTIRKLLP